MYKQVVLYTILTNTGAMCSEKIILLHFSTLISEKRTNSNKGDIMIKEENSKFAIFCYFDVFFAILILFFYYLYIVFLVYKLLICKNNNLQNFLH